MIMHFLQTMFTNNIVHTSLLNNLSLEIKSLNKCPCIDRIYCDTQVTEHTQYSTLKGLEPYFKNSLKLYF